jgi:hypothetical protein
MKHYLLLLVLAFTLSGCFVSADPAYVNSLNDPDSAAALQAQAEAARQEAQRLEAEARAAAANEAAQAQVAQQTRELAATATAQALNVAHAQLAMTADAVNLPSTQAAVFAQQTLQALQVKATVDAQALLVLQQQAQATATAEALSAQQTAEAIQAQSTLEAEALIAAQQQTQATATAQALQRDNETANQVANTSQQLREVGLWLIPLLAIAAFGLVMLLGTKFVSSSIDRANERRRLEDQRLASLLTTPAETIILVGDPRTAINKLQLLNKQPNGEGGDTSKIIDADEPPMVVILSKGEVVPPDRAEASEEAVHCKLALKLVRDAIDHTDAQSNRIPSAEQLGWPSGDWAMAVAFLKPYGVEILHDQDSETYLIGQFTTLETLYSAIGERYLTYSPQSAETVVKGTLISLRDLLVNPGGENSDDRVAA